MFFEENTTWFVWLVAALFVIVVGSFTIPVFGYHLKRWKGAALGCLLQPVIGVLFLFFLGWGMTEYNDRIISKMKEAAMVTVRTTEAGSADTDTLTWYLKPDEECLVEYLRHVKKDGADSISTDEDADHFDVIRLDSIANAVCVEDRIIVRFDLKSQKATVTDYDKPAEVVSVDWDKVRAYFQENSQKKKKR